MHPTDEALNEYVDGERAPERGDVHEHIRTCDACRELVADLRELRRAATRLRPVPPPARAWDAIERGLTGGRTTSAGRTASRWDLSHWGWLAAAATIVLATLIGLRFGLRERSDEAAGNTSAQTVAAELQQAEAHYQKAIEGLERVANAEKSALDPAVAATLQNNLAIVDRAIAESRAALQAQPASEPAQSSLLDSFKAKITLLQNTVAIINDMRKGNQSS